MSDPITEQSQTNSTDQPVQQNQVPAKTAAKEQSPKKKSRTNVPLLILVWLLVIVVILILSLFISSYIAGFDSVFDMINWIGKQL